MGRHRDAAELSQSKQLVPLWGEAEPRCD